MLSIIILSFINHRGGTSPPTRSPGPRIRPVDSSPDPPAPETLLPLKALEFSILLVLAREESYGYGIVQAISDRDAGGLELAPGNLYHVLDRMIGQGLIREAERRERPDDADSRRRYYAITPFGRQVARAEAERLRAVLGTAESLELLAGEGGG